MFKRYITIAFIVLISVPGLSQSSRDTVPIVRNEELEIDTSLNFDELMNEMDLFLDSLLKPRSFFLANVSLGSNYFNYWRRNLTQLESSKRGIFSTTLGYYHKSGLGLTVSGNVTDDEEKLNLYQFTISPSFDFITSTNWTAGISYTRYITKDSLPFYTSPLQNEINAILCGENPGCSREFPPASEVEAGPNTKRRERFIERLRRRKPGSIVNVTNTNETVADFLVTGFVRHSFYWMHVLHSKDHVKLTPQVSFSAGSQKFGFNGVSSTYAVNRSKAATLISNSGDFSIDDHMKFQPISLTLQLRPEYAFGKFFIQPQFILDYYIPSESLTPLFYLNAGVVF